MAKFDIKNDIKFATKPLYAGVGVTDLAVERVRGLVSEAQKRTQKRVAEAQKNVRKVELEPKALRDQAVDPRRRAGQGRQGPPCRDREAGRRGPGRRPRHRGRHLRRSWSPAARAS